MTALTVISIKENRNHLLTLVFLLTSFLIKLGLPVLVLVIRNRQFRPREQVLNVHVHKGVDCSCFSLVRLLGGARMTEKQ
jgi:hypothetical protein